MDTGETPTLSSNCRYTGRCMVCGAEMRYFFTKVFNSWGLASLDYEKCTDCGFSVCASLLRMPDDEWVALNNWFHTEIYQRPGDPYNRAGRLAGQARVIDLMSQHGLISQDRPMLDWGSGTGDLAAKVQEHGRTLFSYDRYITPVVNRLPGVVPEPGGFSLVIAAAVFEHLKDREELDAIEALVADDGVLGFHILVPREIPADPDWVYLLPVHCAFHNWESIRRLMVQWGYAASAYCTEALMWFFFRSKDGVKEKIEYINRVQGYQLLIYSDGFISSTGVELSLELAHSSPKEEMGECLYVGARARTLDSAWTNTWIDFGNGCRILSASDGVPIALEEGSFDRIYCDSVAERMTPEQFQTYLTHMQRLLKPRGVLRIVTTDISRVLDSASQGTWADFPWVKQAGIATSAEYLNAVFRSWGHTYLYDSETLMRRLFDCGYRDVVRTSIGLGRSAAMNGLDRDTHRIYVEAVR